MKAYFDQIKNCISSNGELIAASEEVISSIAACETLAVHLLGCTLTVRGKRFIIRMLEIYYGGVANDAHVGTKRGLYTNNLNINHRLESNLKVDLKFT
ncbi:MAG: hypothetical protein ICV53_21975 [Flavisolibacter sp.]|nr:hypothetical protein [Flavisolibacter sp.]